jgi:hypothetical protein
MRHNVCERTKFAASGNPQSQKLVETFLAQIYLP